MADEKKNLSKKQHVPLDPPPAQFVPLPHFTPTRMPDWDSASNSNNHLSLGQILEDENLKLNFNLPVWRMYAVLDWTQIIWTLRLFGWNPKTRKSKS